MAESKRAFRSQESYEAEAYTRDCVKPFLDARGFVDIADDRTSIGGEGQSQIVTATDSEGNHLKIRVRTCWKWWHQPPSRRKTSAAQLAARVKGTWEATLDNILERQMNKGVTHFLLVQGDESEILLAALIPIKSIRPIWERQRDVSQHLIESGQLKGMTRNHAQNGDSPTMWLKDERRPAAKEVTDILWEWPGVIDLMKVEAAIVPHDDSMDDMPAVDYSMYGSDNAPRIKTQTSGVKRDRRVRQEVIKRATGGCEREGCEDTRTYSGFLDVHHILGVGKSDRVWNCVALCPNCHREAHYSPDADRINAALHEYAKQFEPTQLKVA